MAFGKAQNKNEKFLNKKNKTTAGERGRRSERTKHTSKTQCGGSLDVNLY